MTLSVRVESLGTFKSLKSSKPPYNPFMLGDAFLYIPGIKHPQLIQYFASDANDVLAPGLYDVPVELTAKDGRPSFNLQYRNREKVAASSPAQVRA
jgi:hypothetical protein